MEHIRSVKFYKKKTHHTEKPKIWNISLIPKKKKKNTYIYTKKTGAIRGHVFHPDKNFYTIANNSLLFPTENEQTLDENNLKQDTAHPFYYS